MNVKSLVASVCFAAHLHRKMGCNCGQARDRTKGEKYFKVVHSSHENTFFQNIKNGGKKTNLFLSLHKIHNGFVLHTKKVFFFFLQ